MEHLDNDMDDLFKKAGELYPLKISGSDWEGLAGKLQDPNYGDSGVLSIVPARSTGSRRKWLLLLLLIPIGVAGVLYYSNTINQKRSESKSSAIKPLPEGNSQEPGATAAPAETLSPDRNNNLKIPKTASAKQDQSRNKVAPGQHTYSAVGAIDQRNEKSSSGNHADGLRENESGIASNDKNPVEVNPANNTGAPENEKTDAIQKPEVGITSLPATAGAAPTADKNKTTTKDTPKEESKNNNSSEKKSDPKTSASKGFYAGLVVGPDLSTVKFQSVNQLGFSLGAIVGYRFNKHLAVETGILWDKKYYHTKGEYFKNPQIHIPASINIDGNCNMLEIPVNIRYDFAAEKNHSFFAKAGLSSYLMMKDHYSWTSPPPYNYPVYKSYNAPSNIFSILQLSAGYERAISSSINVQVEPYVKIPLAGVGTGSMPISSVGIYFGITHSFR
jgi:hypothetical protein